MIDELIIIGAYAVLPSDDDLLGSLRQQGYDPVFQGFHESQQREQELAVVSWDPQEKDG
jgi:hypothetical protein